MISKFKKGFSLIELLVVIAIIGILAAVGITAYSGYTAGAKEKASVAQHSQVVALINAEMGRCAAGEGTYVWGTAAVAGREAVTGRTEEEATQFDLDNGNEPGTTPVVIAVSPITQEAFAADACSAAPDDTHIVLHVNGTGAGQLGMNNPYNTGEVAATHLVSQTAQTVVGGIGIFCTGTAAGVCTVSTFNGVTELVKAIPRY